MTIRTDSADVNSLIAYIEDTKPYHSKLNEVEVEYQWSECFTANFVAESSFIETHMSSVWEYEFLSNGSRRIYRIPEIRFPRSKTLTYTGVTDELDMGRVAMYVIDGFIYKHRFGIPQFEKDEDGKIIWYPALDQVTGQQRVDTEGNLVYYKQPIFIDTNGDVIADIVAYKNADPDAQYSQLKDPAPAWYSTVPVFNFFDEDGELELPEQDYFGRYVWGMSSGAYEIPSNNGVAVKVNGILLAEEVHYRLEKERTIIQFLPGHIPEENDKIDVEISQLDRIFVRVLPEGYVKPYGITENELKEQWITYKLENIGDDGSVANPDLGPFDVEGFDGKYVGNDTYVAIPMECNWDPDLGCQPVTIDSFGQGTTVNDPNDVLPDGADPNTYQFNQIPFGVVRINTDENGNEYWVWEFTEAPALNSQITLRVEEREAHNGWTEAIFTEKYDFAEIHEFYDDVNVEIYYDPDNVIREPGSLESEYFDFGLFDPEFAPGYLGLFGITIDEVDTVAAEFDDNDQSAPDPTDIQAQPEPHVQANASFSEDFEMEIGYNLYDTVSVSISDRGRDNEAGYNILGYDMRPYDLFVESFDIDVEITEPGSGVIDSMGASFADGVFVTIQGEMFGAEGFDTLGFDLDDLIKITVFMTAKRYTTETPANEITANHNLGYRPTLIVYTEGGQSVQPDIVEHINNDNTVRFTVVGDPQIFEIVLI